MRQFAMECLVDKNNFEPNSQALFEHRCVALLYGDVFTQPGVL